LVQYRRESNLPPKFQQPAALPQPPTALPQPPLAGFKEATSRRGQEDRVERGGEKGRGSEGKGMYGREGKEKRVRGTLPTAKIPAVAHAVSRIETRTKNLL